MAIVEKLASVMGMSPDNFANNYLHEMLSDTIENKAVGDILVTSHYFDTEAEATISTALADQLDGVRRNWTLLKCQEGIWADTDGFVVSEKSIY